MVCTLHEGDDFGKLALVTDSPRAASIVLREDNCHFLRVDKEDFNRILRVGGLVSVPLITHDKLTASINCVLCGAAGPLDALWLDICLPPLAQELHYILWGHAELVSFFVFAPLLFQGRGSKHGALERARAACAGVGEESSALHAGKHQVGVLHFSVKLLLRPILLPLPFPTLCQHTLNGGKTPLGATDDKARS